MSTLTLATSASRGTVGFAAKYSEPSSPRSSAVTNRKSTERRGRFSSPASTRATSSTTALPSALS